MKHTIPETAFPFKEGLYINEYTIPFGKTEKTIWELFAAEGYCFYDLQIPENYDEDGNLLPEDQLVHYKYSKMPKDEEYVTNNIFPVPCTSDTDIV